MSLRINDLASAVAAIELAISTFEKLTPTVLAGIEYFKKENITDEDVAAMKAQDQAAADNQQRAIDKAKARSQELN
jgi:hypothetical protein